MYVIKLILDLFSFGIYSAAYSLWILYALAFNKTEKKNVNNNIMYRKKRRPPRPSRN